MKVSKLADIMRVTNPFHSIDRVESPLPLPSPSLLTPHHPLPLFLIINFPSFPFTRERDRNKPIINPKPFGSCPTLPKRKRPRSSVSTS